MAPEAMDPETFITEMMNEYRDRMERTVDEYYNTSYFETFNSTDDLIKTEFPHTAWRELFFGCLPANRQISLVYEMGDPYGRDRDLIVGLLKQVRDEVKHARIFSNLSEQFGVESDLVTWEAEYQDRLVAQCRTAVEWDQPHFVACAFQCSTEIAAAFMINNLADYIEPEYSGIATTLRDVASDEGDHVHVGRLTARRFATSDDLDRMEEIAEMKYESVVDVLKAL
jgi:hypothetical protein